MGTTVCRPGLDEKQLDLLGGSQSQQCAKDSSFEPTIRAGRKQIMAISATASSAAKSSNNEVLLTPGQIWSATAPQRSASSRSSHEPDYCIMQGLNADARACFRRAVERLSETEIDRLGDGLRNSRQTEAVRTLGSACFVEPTGSILDEDASPQQLQNFRNSIKEEMYSSFESSPRMPDGKGPASLESSWRCQTRISSTSGTATYRHDSISWAVSSLIASAGRRSHARRQGRPTPGHSPCRWRNYRCPTPGGARLRLRAGREVARTALRGRPTGREPIIRAFRPESGFLESTNSRQNDPATVAASPGERSSLKGSPTSAGAAFRATTWRLAGSGRRSRRSRHIGLGAIGLGAAVAVVSLFAGVT